MGCSPSTHEMQQYLDWNTDCYIKNVQKLHSISEHIYNEKNRTGNAQLLYKSLSNIAENHLKNYLTEYPFGDFFFKCMHHRGTLSPFQNGMNKGWSIICDFGFRGLSSFLNM